MSIIVAYFDRESTGHCGTWKVSPSLAAVNADSRYGRWIFEMVNRVSGIPAKIDAALAKIAAGL
jgi:hypothetical protein